MDDVFFGHRVVVDSNDPLVSYFKAEFGRDYRNMIEQKVPVTRQTVATVIEQIKKG